MDDDSGNESRRGGNGVRMHQDKRDANSWKRKSEQRPSSSRHAQAPRSKRPFPNSFQGGYDMSGGYGFDGSYAAMHEMPFNGSSSNGPWDMNAFVPMPFVNADAYTTDSSSFQVPSRYNGRKPFERSKGSGSANGKHREKQSASARDDEQDQDEEARGQSHSYKRRKKGIDAWSDEEMDDRKSERSAGRERQVEKNGKGRSHEEASERPDDRSSAQRGTERTEDERYRRGRDRSADRKDSRDVGHRRRRDDSEDDRRRRNDSEDDRRRAARRVSNELKDEAPIKFTTHRRQSRSRSRSADQRRNNDDDESGRGSKSRNRWDMSSRTWPASRDIDRRSDRYDTNVDKPSRWNKSFRDRSRSRDRQYDKGSRTERDRQGQRWPKRDRNRSRSRDSENGRQPERRREKEKSPVPTTPPRDGLASSYARSDLDEKVEGTREASRRDNGWGTRRRPVEDHDLRDDYTKHDSRSKARYRSRPDESVKEAKSSMGVTSEAPNGPPPSDAMQAAMKAALGIPISNLGSNSSTDVAGRPASLVEENEEEPADLHRAPSIIRARPDEVYEQVAQVGEGTYGQVFKAKADKTGVIVALKKIRMESEKDGFPITAMREIKILQGLRHENVVRLHEMLLSKNSIYMVFEYLEHDLNGILSQPSIHFTPAHLKSLAKQLLAGLAYLHRQSILHRDLKGSNLLLHRDGTLKLADFGLARRYTKRVKSNVDYTNRVVTLWYRPPELLFGETCYNDAIDVWGAGCIFLELFTRKPTFQGFDEIHQVQVLYELLGPIQKQDWPEADALPWYDLVRPVHEAQNDVAPKTFQHSRLYEMLASQMPPDALEVAAALLSYNPSRRISASGALEMEYFAKNLPRPQKPKDILEKVEGEWHELESRIYRRGTQNQPPGSAAEPGPVVSNSIGQMGPPDTVARVKPEEKEAST